MCCRGGWCCRGGSPLDGSSSEVKNPCWPMVRDGLEMSFVRDGLEMSFVRDGLEMSFFRGGHEILCSDQFIFQSGCVHPLFSPCHSADMHFRFAIVLGLREPKTCPVVIEAVRCMACCAIFRSNGHPFLFLVVATCFNSMSEAVHYTMSLTILWAPARNCKNSCVILCLI